MTKIKIYILLFNVFGLLGASVGQIVQLGQCEDNYQLAEDFDIEQFSGQWHEISRIENTNLNGDCASFNFATVGNTINVNHYAVNDNFLQESQGTANLVANTARLTLSISAFENPVDFWVLMTDYSNFAVTFSCENISTVQRRIYLWVLGRETSFPNEMIPALITTNINNVFGIQYSSLSTIDHSNDACYVLPIIQPGQPIVLPGQCDPNIPVVQNFDVAAFTGIWHQISSYYSENSDGSCARAQYTLADGVVNVVNSQVVNQALDSITGTASVASTDNSAKLSVILNIAPGVAVTQDLWILATDYNNYGVSYTCVDLPNNQKQVFSWIISRSRTLSAASQAQVDQVVNSILDLNYQYYINTDQSDAACFYYPEPVPNQPVVFRGQCDLNIPAMANFDPVAYMGLWHNIELYPQAFQEGTCGNAQYTLVDGRVEVFNTQVINQRLDTIDGFAVLVSDDGSAKLEVTFPIAGTDFTITTNYWVLDTDYTSYALVYSCFNRNDDEMQVTSWKLSRTKELTAAANTAINNVMSSIQVLDQRYFETSDQSTEGCFYYPEAQAGVPVVFPGQCDNNINAVPTFNMEQFQGQWFEIQAYPKNEQSGQCINHQYTFVSNAQLNFVSSSVVDQFLTLSNGVVTVSSTDGSGRLTISITSDGQTINIPFWILSTDYTDYALAYSCVNIDNDFRGIWSWKLSRTRQLSAAANTAITTAIANIEVLDDVYYENIDQSDDACFYLPELTPGEPVILNGQCDTSITGIANFDLSRYAGRWRLVESYGADSQIGTCNIAEYTFASATTLNAQHSQVVNRELVTVSGTGTMISNNGRLIFSFPSTGASYDVTVLDTDYDSYALLYSCTNLNTEQRRVYSWKLSRQNVLSQAAINNMNNIINSIQVLNNRYYYVVDRSQTGCFYFPEPDTSTMVRFPGQCDESIPTVMNFDAARYLGLWHDIESYPMPFQDGSCPNAFYSLNSDGNVDVFNTQVIGQTLDTLNGLAVIASTDGSAKLSVTFNVQGIDLVSDYWVLATDYDTYALVYSCTNLDDEYKFVSSWKLSRTKALTAAANTAITTVMNTLDILDQRYFVNRDHSTAGCFYFPEPQAGVPVVFPGQCDNTITAVPNFDMSQFQGMWYEIEAYPKDDQPGQCINHQFSLATATTFNLQSSNVNNLALELTSSNVAFATNDGTGRLVITLTSNGQQIQIPFWILSTDYTDYALAYSCVNIDNDFRGIWSWKLSRAKQLSTAANTAINNAIANIEVLDNVYYEDIQQTDESCFYLPELAPGDPIVFPGQCDLNIPVMQNFDAGRYLGRWKLIETYPSNFQEGTCNEATYSLNADGSVEVYNTEVVNQVLNAEIGNAVIAATDGSGKLSVTFPNNPVPIDYWILDTDYETYTIIYSCANLNTEQRRVWSWKMSRTDTLSAAATNAINQVVNSVNVLDQRYYQTVDRSAAACFYFPEADVNTPVRFRGQCDESIPTVMNFDAARYLGLWHDIESYPMPFQDGSCPNAFYSLNSDGNVDVFNTQVIGQTLDTINGLAVIASTDGSAKLSVTFNVQGVDLVSNYWVLATDYDSYAMVYSCTNLDDEYKFVASWKLSRTKALTAAANTAITTVMNTLDVLDQRYFVNRDHSTAGCFYFPEPQAGVPVVFPGQCDNTIAAVPNFDMSQFQGMWYEIEAYPKDDQPGQCINHQFSLATATTFNLQSSNVNNLALELTSSNVAFATNDATGRLVITLTSNGQQIQIPFWILSTDYTDYALAYSCVNIDNDFRGIWSWKLSRAKQLSTAANTAINNAIANIEVLDNVYYESIQQTDESCFYLPDLAPGDPIVFPGQCDLNIPVMQNFDAGRYLGRWKLIETYPSNFQEGTCNEATYSLNADGSVEVYNTEVVNQILNAEIGNAVIAATDGSGKLSVTFPNNPVPIDYWILDTDYETYTIIYSCANLNTEQRRVWSWKMSRTDTLSAAATNAINQVVNSVNVLDQRYYQTVDRSAAACFYFPEADVNTPVRFRGQCDESIPTVMNFDAARYLGLWHDIESYPMPFQDGSCPNAFYSLNSDGNVDVFNTQVISQTLDTINGLAVIASTDGSAKLSVTFNVQGVDLVSNYWVLATDYDSYAMVYSCTNLDDEYKFVASWKLSRTKALTAAANTAITNVMNTLDVLDQRYFVNRDHSTAGCFYFPEPQAGVPVVFPGQCDNTIAAVPNFDMSQFQGMWYEIEAYPKDDQPGQCINHQFSLATATTFNLQSSNVNNLALELTSSNVAFATNDGTGRLVITLTSNGQQIQIPFWILSTDYTDYALAYSCVNIDNDFRGIWSWKLSRAKQLSTAANTAINNAIANIEVLDNVYYEDIQQTDESCFYLPELAPGDPIVFPGQCDLNIPVMQNFDAGRYLGRWKLIETYPSNFQEGTCNEATYSLNADGSVEVYNTEVVNQILNAEIGNAVIAATDGSGKLSVTFPNNPVPIDYWILDTDYETYTIIYSCANLNTEQRRVWSWKMSRTDTLSAAATNAINQVVNSVNVLDQRYYQTVDRSAAACFYFPEADVNTPVRFRGQCDESIPTVMNFDAARYLGLWHDIESYPMPFQDGSCPNAFYSLNSDGNVDVFNTQVISQTLDTINGLAVIASTDGSAKLSVTFNVQGVDLVSNYWVLATDYDSYAMVYSCTNLDDEYKFVASWKLSRTKALTAAANTAITNVMNTLDVLDQRYFVNRDHSTDGCFYFPEPQAGVPVVFPGQCDNTIAAVPNFDMSQFQGMWYEIEAYPKDDQPGQCINHQFSLATATTFNLQSSNVNNLALELTSSNVGFAATDGSGRLVITLTANGQQIQIPFWILSTDYTDYALAYSCVNIDNDFRGIWSWKLSRNKQLSAIANTAINNAMTSIDVLDNVYFEDIQQTDEACFYLPELGPNDPVVFPGQCDQNISVVQNFDAARYLGRWRLIETYPSNFQEGTCNEATYSLAEDGSVVVYNTEVVNEALLAQTGRAIIATTDGSGKLSVTFPDNPVPIDYWILDTDYDTYTLIYSCANINTEQRRVWSWKMSRTNSLTAAATTAINQVVDTINVLDDRYYQTVDRSATGCFYYPTPNADSTVIFPGQCDETIPPLPSFNPTAYSGLWYAIESYPGPFQTGSCSNARYTLNNDGSLNVENTQVVNQMLDSWIGSGVLAADGSAKYDVTYVINGIPVTTTYLVLDTDYTSFTILYSCRNIDDETREVYSWKLSRTPTLTAAANNAINNIISLVPVLDQQYYVERGHTEADCLYYPDNNGGDVVLEGLCAPETEIPMVTNFNANLFSGTWHEVARFPSTIQNGECTRTGYSLNSDNTYSIVQTDVRDEREIDVVTQASISTDGRGIITGSIDGVPFDTVYILATDYTEYALAYSCRNLDDNSKQIYSWKFSRSQAGLSQAANAVIDQTVFDNIDLFENYYQYTGQDVASCFHYPVYDELPDTIELLGPCDASIRGVPNFDAAAYLGRWFEIARYPQLTQPGQCSRAEYSLGDGNVNVTNTEVLDLTLETQLGTAVVASTDGSGQLDVTFVVNGVTLITNYYILATDYNNYALVYSCANLPTGNRQVGSWKLSRDKTLSAEELAIMNAIITNIEGLAEEYYQLTSQSDEDCFYIPEVNPSQAPLFRGQCEDLPVISNFEPQRYVGWWHEIERYPVDRDVGQCISSQYEQANTANNFNVVATSVTDGVAEVTTGVAVITEDGRLVRTLNGQVEDFYILATDYETYSLIYMCENVGEEYRRVWSAKHSKARSLTAAAQTAMAPEIENNLVLYSQFYQQVDQSDAACFHYPDQTGSQVIIPGQCNENMPVVQNFDIIGFAGTWYQIERYDEVGVRQCIGVRAVAETDSDFAEIVYFDNISGDLNTAEGVARVISTDGSGRLSIAMPLEDSDDTVTTTVYVLATDYENYAIMYSCINLNEFERQVGAWKLSRERTLSSESISSISTLITQTPELHEPYFKEIVHDEDCTDPSSALLVKSSIIVILVCATLQLLL